MAYHQIDNRQNGKLAKCLVDKMANWPNGKLKNGLFVVSIIVNFLLGIDFVCK